MKAARKITQARLHEVLDYNPETGVFVWRKQLNARGKVGAQAGRTMWNGSMFIHYIRVDSEEITASRAAWLYMHGSLPKCPIRFRNGDTTDCRMENLRLSITIDPGKFDHRTPEGRAAYGKAHRRQYRELYRDKELRKNFGITLAQYDAKYTAQGGLCAICGQPERGMRDGHVKRLAVDHDHTTGQLRDLLCNSCNPMLGYAGDDPDLLIAAAAYLKRHRSPTESNIVRLVSKEPA